MIGQHLLTHRPVTLVCLAAGLLLSGCATPAGQFPSLARRPFEKAVDFVPPAPPQTPVETRLPDGLAAQMDSLKMRHNIASSAFAALLPSVQSAVDAAAGSPIGGEGWVNAHLMVSRLDKSRGDSAAALAQLDIMLTGLMDKESQQPAILASPLILPDQIAMGLDVDRQNYTINRLSNMLGR